MHSMFHMGDNDKFFVDWKYLVEHRVHQMQPLFAVHGSGNDTQTPKVIEQIVFDMRCV